jgi:NADPH-dependent glutamate synthase beta subunit-like oxidoreductase
MLVAAAVIGGIGVVAALGLGIAARFFAVHVDPRVSAVAAVLPGANCGGCGFAGCSSAAEAVVKGRASTAVCLAGGPDVAVAVAGVLGVAVEIGEIGMSESACRHSRDDAIVKYDYDGVPDCRAANLVAGGFKACSMGCLGLGTCVRACPFGALVMGDDGLPHVIASKCTACGTCERVCPRHAIEVQTPSRRVLHVQTTSECLAPCQATCPAQIRIPAYIAAIGEGRYEDAVRIIKEANPLPLVCGRICPHPCEAACRRGDADEGVDINHLKRFAADYELRSGTRIAMPKLAPSGKRVAVIGGGPSGLSCANFLARLGHGVTIFEAMPKAGGMLRYGIPEYRLPKKILDWEIAGILDLGVELRVDQRLGRDFTLDDLLGTQGFDAVYVAVGAWSSRRLGLDGEAEVPQVSSGTDFLIERGLDHETPLGRNVIVVGGGNTAMDCARTALRLGAENVHLVYRRSRDEMPANDVEVVEGEHEGVHYQFLSAPTRLVTRDGSLAGLECQRMALGEPDASGRRRPVPVEGSETVIEADNVLCAIGQSPDLSCLSGGEIAGRLRRTRWDSIAAEEGTMQTEVPNVFAGGDAWRGAATAVEAIRDGRFASRAIHLLLSGREIDLPDNWLRTPPKLPGLLPEARPPARPRVHPPELPLDERLEGFAEVELGLTEEMARTESARCLQCGLYCYTGCRERAS